MTTNQTTEWQTLDITARQLMPGDLYMYCGSAFQAQDVRYDQPANRDGETRTCWTAVWTGVGIDPHPGWHRYGSGGNEHRAMKVLRAS